MRLVVAAVLLCSAALGADDPALKGYEERLAAYVKLRKQVADTVPPSKRRRHPRIFISVNSHWLRRSEKPVTVRNRVTSLPPT